MDETYVKLRGMALSAVADGLAPAPGVVVDIPSGENYATLVAFAADTTSFYTSTGGGTTGAGAAPAVRAAVRVLLDEAGRHALGDVAADLPAPDTVRFHFLTAAGRHGADVPLDAFWRQAGHPLAPLIAAAQDVITALRESNPKERGAPRRT